MRGAGARLGVIDGARATVGVDAGVGVDVAIGVGCSS
jgi:hypothetical protein